MATASETRVFIEDYGLTGYSILLDTFHMDMEERDFIQAVRTAGTLLGHMHMSDSTKLVPGTARINFQSLVAGLRAIGYQGWLSLECRIERDEELEAANGLACLKQALGQSL